jgi:asparagine synthase (glutamine-hydrolysing)
VALKIRRMTEKYILREATRDVLTDEVYRRRKHPFLSPPATLHPDEELHELMQDTLRGSDVESVPFLDPAGVRTYLDALDDEDLDIGDKVVADQVLNMVLCTVFLQRGLRLAS